MRAMSTQAPHSNMSKVERGAKQKEEHRVKTSLRMVQAAVMECEAEEAKQQRSRLAAERRLNHE